MAERSNAAVLKTVDCYRSGGSNPSLSANPFKNHDLSWFFCFQNEPSLLVRIYWEQKNKWRSHWFLNWLKPPHSRDAGAKRRQSPTQGMPEQSDGNPPTQGMPEQSDGHPQIKRPPNGWPIISNAIKSYC